tara:strand:- start:1109 stop:3016 length:1908 start_codon:yes stop_codon:yes gene_type:complete
MTNTEHRYTLGMNLGRADPSATLFDGADVLTHVEEERFIRVKKAYGRFPINAVKYCLSLVPDGLNSIESINLGFDHDMFTLEVPLYFQSEWDSYPTKPEQAGIYEKRRLEEKDPRFIEARMRKEFEAAGILNDYFPPIRHYTHHLCHALSAHLSSPYEDSLGIVVDANSEIDTFSVWTCRSTNLEKIWSKPLPHSLGWVYRSFTLFCGFEPYEGEGKLMGLAPYGRPNPEIAEKIRKIISWSDDPDDFDYEVDATYIYLSDRYPKNQALTNKFVNLFGDPAVKSSEPDQYYKDVAYEIQDAFEQLLLAATRSFLKQTGFRNLTLSGGVHLNCKVNGYIWRECQDLLDDLFVFPMSGDDGIGFGANLAYAVEEISSDRSLYQLENAYLGPSFSNEEIDDAIRNFELRSEFLNEKQYSAVSKSLGLDLDGEQTESALQGAEYEEIAGKARAFLSENAERSKSIIDTTAQALAEGSIIAWFQGRMEAGPRALGSRSILADPRKIENRDRVNAKVKFRETWRPFCPSAIEEDAEKYFANPTQSPFMINTFEVTEEGVATAPAIVHVDQTARPQFVDRKRSPEFHDLIVKFGELSGVSILLNTSMNIKGEPICCTPNDALQFFLASDIDVLVIGDYIIRK